MKAPRNKGRNKHRWKKHRLNRRIQRSLYPSLHKIFAQLRPDDSAMVVQRVLLTLRKYKKWKSIWMF